MRSRRSFAPAVLVLAVLLLAAACGADDGDGGEQGASSGDGSASSAAPDFVATTLDGGELAAADLDGQDTVLWFWAPWCTTCRGEAPNVVAAAEAFEGDVQVVGVAGRGEVPEMEGFVSDTGTDGLTHVVDDDGAIWSSFEVISQPAFAFIDDGGDVEVVIGALGEAGLTERMDALAAA